MNGSNPTSPSGETSLPRPMPCRRRTRSFPSPRPSPIARGRIARHLGAQSERFERSPRGEGNRNFAMSESLESCSLPMNLVAADVRRLIPFRLKEVGASSRRLLRFRGSMREVFRGNLSLGERVRVRGTRRYSSGGNRPFPQLWNSLIAPAEPEVAPTES